MKKKKRKRGNKQFCEGITLIYLIVLVRSPSNRKYSNVNICNTHFYRRFLKNELNFPFLVPENGL